MRIKFLLLICAILLGTQLNAGFKKGELARLRGEAPHQTRKPTRTQTHDCGELLYDYEYALSRQHLGHRSGRDFGGGNIYEERALILALTEAITRRPIDLTELITLINKAKLLPNGLKVVQDAADILSLVTDLDTVIAECNKASCDQSVNKLRRLVARAIMMGIGDDARVGKARAIISSHELSGLIAALTPTYTRSCSNITIPDDQMHKLIQILFYD